VKASGYKNTLPHFNVLYVLNGLLEHTTFDLTYEHIPTNVLSCALYVVKPLHVNMIGNVTRAFIREKRNLFVVERSRLAEIGVVADALLELTPWGATSDLRQEEYVSGRF
jgi:hypothetical protein